MSFLRKFLILFLALLLTGCGGVLSVQVDQPDTAQATVAVLQTQVATLLPAEPRLSMQANSETIRLALLNSHEKWEHVWVAGTATPYVGPDAQPAGIAFQAWIDQPNARFRLLQGLIDLGQPQMAQISDGSSVARITLPSGVVEQQSLPDAARQPFVPPTTQSDTIYTHPLISLMDSLATPAFYAGDLAQRGGEYRPIEMTEQAGRPALMVEWQHDGQALDWMWIDAETGLLLRWQSHGKGDAKVVLEVVITAVRYEPVFAAELFDPGLSEPPVYLSDVNVQPTASPEPPPAAFDPTQGQLYFTAYGGSSGLHLLRLPSRCVSGAEPCPAAAVVAGYPNVGTNIESMYWSPDGSTAAAIIYDQLQHTNVLWLYRPADDTWTALAQYPILYGPIVWSPDSLWVSFSAQIDGSQPENLFALTVDGQRAHDLTGGTMASEDSRLVPLTWLNNQTVVFMFASHQVVEFYTARPDSSLPSRLNDMTLPRGAAAISPDRTLIAWSEVDSMANSSLWLSNLDGTDMNQVFGISSASIQQIEWSPDGAQVAIVALVTRDATTTSTIYLMDKDGDNMRQIYSSSALARLAFAPDAPLMVVEDIQLNKLIVVPLDGSRAYLLQAPNLLMDDQLLGISWRPIN